jgi:hypothetical protein
MGLIAKFKAKRAAKQAKAAYELALYEWERESKVLSQALDIFTGAAKGIEPVDNQLAQEEELQPMLVAPKEFLFH